MATTCLGVCGSCQRHVRCGERSCPFCGASVATRWSVLEYRLKTRLDRGRLFSLGAAFTAAGFAVSCEGTGGPVYGVPCTPTICPPLGGSNPSAGVDGGGTGPGGSGGVAAGGVGTGGAGGVATGGAGGVATGGTGGSSSGSGGTAGALGLAGADPGGAGGEAGASIGGGGSESDNANAGAGAEAPGGAGGSN